VNTTILGTGSYLPEDVLTSAELGDRLGTGGQWIVDKTTLELPGDAMHLTVDRFGNTGAGSIPITLDDAVREGRVTPGAHLLFIAIGGGMTWGGVAVRWAGDEHGRMN
jgi:3-oxoacyl-[acyl-carrier-protein] synthase III